MNHTFELSGETANLALSESLSIEDAAQLKDAVSETLSSATHLSIDLSGVTSIDLCCLQVLCSAHRTAVAEGKNLALLNPGDWFLEALRETGYLRHVGCMKTGGHNCLWTVHSGENSEAVI